MNDSLKKLYTKENCIEAIEILESRLDQIAQIIEDVDFRCTRDENVVTPTLQEITQKEISEIYALASAKKRAKG